MLILFQRQGKEYVVHLLVSHKVMDPALCVDVPKTWDVIFPSELLPIDGCEDRLIFYCPILFCMLIP